MSCLLYLVRHGATANNLARPPRLQGRVADVELSAEGYRQAEQTAKLLSGIPMTRLFASPLVRAQQTATVIARPQKRDVETVEAITEADVGAWEGRSWEEIARSEPEAYERFMSDPASHGYLDGENMTQVFQRVQPAIEQILRENDGGRVVVVGHNVVNRVFLSQVMDLPLRRSRSVNQDNCGVTVARYREGSFKLLTLNSIFHLDESKSLR